MSGFRPVDEDARARARHDHATSLVIEAGAGTGKTTLLVDRIEAMVRTGAARLEEIAAVTFTENAATTMKLRLRERLEHAARHRGIRSTRGEQRRHADAIEHIEGIADQLRGARLDLKAEALLVAHAAQDTRGVVDETPLVQHTQQAAFEIEPPFVFNSEQHIIRILEAIDSPYVKTIFDPSHFDLMSGSRGKPHEMLQRIGVKNIGYVHLTDCDGTIFDGTSRHLPCGDGHVDIPAALAMLKEGGFQGWIMIDQWKIPDPYDASVKGKQAIERAR